ncbi:MAG: methylated-DNA--[protein]-cysteine S-methyltransferase [Deltaproteobacteria bacterium]|nr:methylated-DNA--[protein]-cysteine S-methyltransferase [Deltaproteobacteria bacterium]
MSEDRFLFIKAPSPVECIEIGLSEKGVFSVKLLRIKGKLPPEICRKEDEYIRSFFDNYFACNSAGFSANLDLRGSEFEKKVWLEIMKIPYGFNATYGMLAERVGSPGGARAVGQACGKNPLPIIVPCHRVVSSTGIGGFALGVELKKHLINLEGRAKERSRVQRQLLLHLPEEKQKAEPSVEHSSS